MAHRSVRGSAANPGSPAKASAPVVELVDALDSKSCSERSAGSSPAWGTILWLDINIYGDLHISEI